MNVTTTETECWYCAGTGKVKADVSDGHEEADCDRCHGTGKAIAVALPAMSVVSAESLEAANEEIRRLQGLVKQANEALKHASFMLNPPTYDAGSQNWKAWSMYNSAHGKSLVLDALEATKP